MLDLHCIALKDIYKKEKKQVIDMKIID